MELYADALEKKNIDFAPSVGVTKKAQESNEGDISLRDFLRKYNQFAKDFNLRIQNLNPMEQLSEKPFPIIDLSKSLQSICCDLNRGFQRL